MTGDDDKRKHPRLDVKVTAKFRVPTNKMDISMASIKNVSGGGLCLLTNSNLTDGQIIQVEFGLPSEGATIIAAGEVVWISPLDEKDVKFKYQFGIKFIEIDKDRQKTINKFVISRLKHRIKEEIEKNADAQPRGGRRHTLLAIDDDKVTLELMKKIFGDEFNIVTATNGYEGVEKAREWQPDLILLDIVMPDMDGFSTLILLKDFDETRDIPVIMLSILKDKNNIFQAIRAGAQDYIMKPFSVDKLVGKINKIVADNKKEAK